MKDITKRLSKSKLNSYKACPFMYYCQQMFPEEFVTSDAMIRGSELHELFEKVFIGERKETLNSREKLEAKFKTLPNNEKYPDQIKKFIDFQERMEFIYPESFEEKVYDPQLDVVAMWDRIDYDGESRVIIDYKSGRLKKVKEFKYELLVYAYIFMRKYKKPVDYVAIYFIDHGVFDIMEVTKKDMDDFVVEMSSDILEMKTNQKTGVWPCKRNINCRWCSYKDRCSLMKGK